MEPLTSFNDAEGLDDSSPSNWIKITSSWTLEPTDPPTTQEQTTVAAIVLCNPKFINKNNRYFGLSSIYSLYPLASLPKMVKQEMPASIKQS